MKTPKSPRLGRRIINRSFAMVLFLALSQSTMIPQSIAFLSTPASSDVAGVASYNWGLDLHYDSAISFTTPSSPYAVSGIDLFLNGYAPNQGITGHISFYNVNSGTWLNQIYYGPASVGSGAFVWVSFQPANDSEVVLLPNTTYLMNVTADGSPGFNWLGSAHPPGIPASGVAQYVAFYDYGVVSHPLQDSYIVPSFSIYAAPVPEPNSFVLLGFGFLVVVITKFKQDESHEVF
jgi:hypothetical protein